jgi:filamentous hemagglutinin family protein
MIKGDSLRGSKAGRSLLEFLVGLGVIGFGGDGVMAQSVIVPDGMLGAERSVVEVRPTQERITGGAVRGINLFHSFGEFNVGAGRSTYFIAPNAGIENILARVTGTNRSDILGKLGTARLVNQSLRISNANLFLMNPNGIVFGPSSSLDVDRSFVSTTANAIGFGDRGTFSATTPTNPQTLLTINPSAYLFSQLPIGNIVVRSGNGSRLRVPNGQSLTLLGGDVLLEGGQLDAWGGRIEVGAVGGIGRVEALPTGALNFEVGLLRGDITLIAGVRIDVRRNQGGDIKITADNLRVSDSRLSAGIDISGGSGNLRSGDIRLDATGTIEIEKGSGIRNTVAAKLTGNAGDVIISAAALNVIGGSQLDASSSGIGDAGNVLVRVRDRVLVEGTSADDQTVSGAFSRIEETGKGKGGNIQIESGRLEVRNGAQLTASTQGQGDAGNVVIKVRDQAIFQGTKANGQNRSGAFSSVGETGKGQGGNVQIEAGSLEMQGGAQLFTSTRGQGNAGNVLIQVRDRVLFEGTSADGQFVSSAFSRVEETGKGKGGNIQIESDRLEVRNGAQLAASTRGQGDAGNVVIKVRDQVLFQDFSSDGQVASGAFSSVATTGKGQGGNVQIESGSLEMQGGAQLVANTRGQGDAGNVVIKVRDQVLFQGRSADGQFPSAALSDVDKTGKGNGGNVQIAAGRLEVRDGARLSTRTEGQGNAGNVLIQVRDQVLFQGRSADGRFGSNAFSSVEKTGEGQGGKIQIQSGSLEIKDGAQLITDTSGIGDAGNVLLQVRDRVLFEGTGTNRQFGSGTFSRVEGTGRGRGGNIQIESGSLVLQDGAVLTTSTGGQGEAGNIILQVRDRVLFQDFSSVLSAVLVKAKGQGGNIIIRSGSLDVRNNSGFVTGTLGQGDAGNIIIQARDRVLFEGNLQSSSAFSSVASTAKGKGGNIQIQSSRLELLDGSQLIAQTAGKGDAGNILINATDYITLSGTNLSNGRSSALFTQTGAPDRDGGNITLNTRVFRLTDGAVINSQTYTSGTSGDITINANTIDILNGGQILAITEGRGRAGTIALNATDRITIQGRDSTYDQRLAQFRNAVAPISSSSGIFVQSQASGGAGNIIINAPSLGLDRTGTLSAISSTVDGGNITLNISKLLTLRNGSQISATAGTANAGGNGGNITINSPNGFLIAIPNENSDITANAFNGSGGRVSITNQGIFGLQFRPKLTELSDITASSQFGFSGTVIINSPDNSAIQNSLNQLPKDAIDTTKLLANTCIVRRDKLESTFYLTGTGGLPNRPSDPSLSNYPTNTIQPTQTANRPWQKGDPIVEPQGFYQLANGRLVMSRECEL